MSNPRRTIHRADMGRPSRDPPLVWAVGPWRSREFAIVRGQLDSAGVWKLLPNIPAAIEALANASPPPEVLLLAQERPGVDDVNLVDELHAAAPLVRVIIVAGTWCEGELRTGRPPVGFPRLYWHELPAWWKRNLTARAAGLAPHWSGPVETQQNQPASHRDASETRGVIAIDSTDYSVFETLESALRHDGFECTWTARGRQPLPAEAIAGIWDGAQLDDVEPQALADFCRQFNRTPAPVVVLLDYPRAEHIDLVQQCGAAAVLGKPYSLGSLLDELTQLMPVTAMFSAPQTAPPSKPR